MNYLGHAFLSFGDADLLAGNMIGDHVKGMRALDAYPEGMARGVMLHRKIDQYTDMHPSLARARNLFREDYGLYSGPVVDSLLDHFLAGDARYFGSEAALLEFTEQTYRMMDTRSGYFPESFTPWFAAMKSGNWLYGYRTLKGMERALQGLHRRAKHMPDPAKAYEIFVSHYYILNQCYYEFIDEAVSFVKNTLTR